MGNRTHELEPTKSKHFRIRRSELPSSIQIPASDPLQPKYSEGSPLPVNREARRSNHILIFTALSDQKPIIESPTPEETLR